MHVGTVLSLLLQQFVTQVIFLLEVSTDDGASIVFKKGVSKP
jgi:hypothetical protein